MSAINITTPVGRLVRGNPETLRPKNGKDGKPKMKADGVTPMQECYFELAIPKGTERHWSETAWGAQIWQVGAASAPAMHQNPAYAWKITDGDSATPNRNNKVPNQQANYPGNWIIKFGSGFIPNRYRRNQAGALEQVVTDGAFKLGYFVQVAMVVQGNGSTESPGVYLNPQMVCFSAYGEEIYVGPDAESAGFGAAPLPPGASATPLAGAMPAAPLPPGAAPAPALPPLVPAAAIAPPPVPVPVAAPAPAGLLPVPGAAHSIEALRAANWTDDQIVAGGFATRAAPLPPAISAPVPAAPAAPAAPVIPNPAFAQIPPPAAAGPTLTAAGAALGTYEGFVAQGWTPDAMRSAGYLV